MFTLKRLTFYILQLHQWITYDQILFTSSSRTITLGDIIVIDNRKKKSLELAALATLLTIPPPESMQRKEGKGQVRRWHISCPLLALWRLEQKDNVALERNVFLLTPLYQALPSFIGPSGIHMVLQGVFMTCTVKEERRQTITSTPISNSNRQSP